MIECKKGNGRIEGNLSECVAEWGILAIALTEEMIRQGESVRDAKLALLRMLADSMELLDEEMKEKESGNV